jgi:TatA/E family protein of Tat protein translocase
MLHPLLAIIDAPIIIGILVVGAILFGADKLPKLARSAGQAKKEFMMGQIEADEATAKAREEARTRIEAQNAEQPAGSTSDKGSPTP